MTLLQTLIFPAMWFPGWLQSRRDAERKRVQIEHVVPPAVTTAAVRWN